MGWKSLKERFGIDHIVHVTDEGVCIGSSMVRDLAVIDPETGAMRSNRVFPDFLKRSYPAMLQAPAKEIVALLAAPDTFERAVVVHTYDGAEIVEKLCEEAGWPNVTYDGILMSDNEFSTDRAAIIRRAKRDAELGVEHYRKRLAELAEETLRVTTEFAAAEAIRLKLETDHPETVAGQTG